jgi:hypothetical protein
LLDTCKEYFPSFPRLIVWIHSWIPQLRTLFTVGLNGCSFCVSNNETFSIRSISRIGAMWTSLTLRNDITGNEVVFTVEIFCTGDCLGINFSGFFLKSTLLFLSPM